MAIAQGAGESCRSVLLLDEPLSNLDARLRLQTREEIRKIQRATRITTVFVTHDQEEAMSISDRIVVMKAGVVQQIGKPQEVYDDAGQSFCRKIPWNTAHQCVGKERSENEKLCIGDAVLLECSGIPKDRAVFVGIRPEGFVLEEGGPLICRLGACGGHGKRYFRSYPRI